MAAVSLSFLQIKPSVLKTQKAHIEAAFYEWLLSSLDEQEQQEFARLLDVLYGKCKEESRAGFPHMECLLASRD